MDQNSPQQQSPISTNIQSSTSSVTELFTRDFDQLASTLLQTLRHYEKINTDKQQIQHKYEQLEQDYNTSQIELSTIQQTLHFSLQKQEELFEKVKLLQSMLTHKDCMLSQANHEIQSLLQMKQELKTTIVNIETKSQYELQQLKNELMTYQNEIELLSNKCIDIQNTSQHELFTLQYDLQQYQQTQTDLYNDKLKLEKEIVQLKVQLNNMKSNHSNTTLHNVSTQDPFSDEFFSTTLDCDYNDYQSTPTGSSSSSTTTTTNSKSKSKTTTLNAKNSITTNTNDSPPSTLPPLPFSSKLKTTTTKPRTTKAKGIGTTTKATTNITESKATTKPINSSTTLSSSIQPSSITKKRLALSFSDDEDDLDNNVNGMNNGDETLFDNDIDDGLPPLPAALKRTNKNTTNRTTKKSTQLPSKTQSNTTTTTKTTNGRRGKKNDVDENDDYKLSMNDLSD